MGGGGMHGGGAGGGGTSPSGGGSRPGSGGGWTGTPGSPGAAGRPPSTPDAPPRPRGPEGSGTRTPERPTAAPRGSAGPDAPPRPNGGPTGSPRPTGPDGRAPGDPGAPRSDAPTPRTDAPGSRPDAPNQRPTGPNGGPGQRPDAGGPGSKPDTTKTPDSTKSPDTTKALDSPKSPDPTKSPDGTKSPDTSNQPDSKGPDADKPKDGPDSQREPDTTDKPKDDADKPHEPDADKPEPGTPEYDQKIDEGVDNLKQTDAGMSGHTDPNHQDLADRVPGDGKHTTVDAHMGPDGRIEIGGRSYSPDEFADVLRRSGWDGESPIRLVSCDSSDFASDLAKKLGVDVTAPKGLAWTDSNGRVFSTSRAPDGGPTWPPDGGWETHSPDGTKSPASDDAFHPTKNGEDPGARPEDADARGRRKIDPKLTDVENPNSPNFKENVDDRIHDPEYRNKYYDERSDGTFHRKNEDQTDFNKDQVPLLRRDNEGNIIVADDQIKEFHRFDGKTDPHTATPAEQEAFKDAVRDRENALDNLKNKKDNYEAEKPDPSEKATEERSQAYADATKKSETLGDQAADLELKNRYGIDVDDPNVNTCPPNDFDPTKTNVITGEGSGVFDKIAISPDGTVVVIEAKAPHADLGNRLDLDGRRVEQGTRPYYEAIVKEMEKRGDDDVADALDQALKKETVDYRLVKAKVTTGPDGKDVFAGYDSSKFDLSPRTDEQGT